MSGIEYDGTYENLTLKEKENIVGLLQKNLPDVHYDIFLQSKINMGMSDKDNNHYNFNVIDNHCGKWLKVGELEDDTIYSADQKKQIPSTVTLEVPIVKQMDGGLSVEKYQDYTLKYSNKADKKNIFENYLHSAGTHYDINYNTYVNLTSIIYNIPKEEVKKNNIIENLFVYIDNLEDVEQVANLLIDKNYATDYTIKAFDSLDKTVQTIIKIIFILIIVFIFTCINLVLSFESFIKLQKKDIAILKHLGYSTLQIIKIYKRNIVNIFIKLGLGISIYTFLLGLLILSVDYLLHVCLLIFVEIFALIFVCEIVLQIILKKYVNMNILELMKMDKSFE